MRFELLFRLWVVGCFVVASSSMAKDGKKKQVTGRKSRQVLEAELPSGVWSPWGEWSECSQSCGVGVSQRSRKCLPRPLPEAPPLSLAPPHWGGYYPGGVGTGPHGADIAAMRPYYPPHYPRNHGVQYGEEAGQPFYGPQLSPNQNQGLSLYRDSPVGGGGGALASQANPAPSLYRPEFSSASQDPVPVYRPPSFPATSHVYSQPARVSRRPANPATSRGGGGGTRRSVSSNREGLPVRRSSGIRPGQFGYGRVPFSLPLHRQARHIDADNATMATPLSKPTASVGEPERKGEEPKGRTAGNERVADADPGGTRESRQERRRGEDLSAEEESQPATLAETLPATTPPRAPPVRHRQTIAERGRERARERPPFRSSAPLPLNRPPFDWHSVAAPPPPGPSHPHHPHSPLHAPAFSSPLHRAPPLHSDPGYSPEAQPAHSNLYPPQRSHSPRPEVEADHRCSGGDTEFRKCFAQVCGGGSTDTRAEQCAAFNTREFMGRIYDWEPFTEVGPDKQCELTCRPVGYRFYVRQAERVRDGTPCTNASTNDVCVAGRCLTEGCDGVLGSASVIDRCGVCDGRDRACRRVTGSFQNTTVPLGYHKILDIPPGATAINVTERRASSNYLALRSGTGSSVVNGRWAVDPPGEYKAGGTTFTYGRPRAQAEGRKERGESLTALGPTTTLLQLYIISHRQNPGIDYEFYLPVERTEGAREAGSRDTEGVRERGRELDGARAPLRSSGTLIVTVDDPPPPPPVLVSSSTSSSGSSSSSAGSSEGGWTPERSRPRGSAPNRNARIPPRTDLPPDTQPPFVWRKGELTECTASCGKGSHYSEILCINRHTDQEVHDRKCDSATKPLPEEEPCNTHPCPPFWEASAWSECSVSCGPGVQQRQLQCRQSFGQRSTMVHPQRCASLTPPDATQACQLRLCSHWEVGSDWTSCSVDCGVGKRMRSVRCVSDHGNVVTDQDCNSRIRPLGSEECHMGPCVTNWYLTDWSDTCSAQCGPGVQRREVVCLTRGGGGEAGGGGDCVGDKPADMKACNGGPCVASHMWYSSPWTQCNVPCGNGTQRRDIICVQKMGTDFTVAPAIECAHLEKPAGVQECEVEPCQPQWFTTEWSACSRSCGKGLQMREARCLTVDKQHSQECVPVAKPEQEQLCNTIPCSPQVGDENCRDRRHNCVMVVQARLCVYAYYKTACCASCTQSAQRAKRH